MQTYDSMSNQKGESTMPKEKDKPVHEIRLGRIKAVIWANEVESGVRHNVQFRRLYKQDDNWEQSDSFGRDELLALGKVADLAHTWIFENAHEKDNEKS